jgi:hypothetical protein
MIAIVVVLLAAFIATLSSPEQFDSFATARTGVPEFTNHTVLTKIGSHMYAFCSGVYNTFTSTQVGPQRVWRYNGNSTTTPRGDGDSWTEVSQFPWATTPEFTVGPVSSSMTEVTDAALILQQPGGGDGPVSVYLWKP